MLVFFLSFTAALSVAEFPVAIADDWIHAAGRSFKYFKDPKSFADASATCASVGGVLAVDDHVEVNKLLAKSGVSAINKKLVPIVNVTKGKKDVQ